MKLIEKEEILKDDTEIAEELNLFFSNAVKSSNIAQSSYITNRVSYESLEAYKKKNYRSKLYKKERKKSRISVHLF